ncbi:DNA-binding MurR/RpiR family transcriptional regulator [Alkalihalobacillus xiaoxiensis]|uniref:DNA-binding MurR/RpiR family transcriptional regulator n=1 Tax=Shouchella xiaoxiensis TaxID=766895 RepID=A0ABS2SWF1_9BACI|nr:MurR/RpiR family transcriptional regulator [Shouchella xiaoxiensis]MBM7839857.1 DNA-binding MurR/RpiR family transcriptional regulator [Shouchella xiaoxiensis]
MKNPIDVLKAEVASLPKSQKLVVDYIIQHYNDVGFMTVEQLAKEVGTSTTTVMRLMNSVGYTGYTEFQKNLHTLLKEEATPQMRLEQNLKQQPYREDWQRHYALQMEQIQKAIQLNSETSLDGAIKQIYSAKRIFCTSVRSGLPVAQYLTHNLNRMLGNSKLTIADSSDWIDDVVGMSKGDLLIAVSYARYGKRLIQYVEQAKKKGVRILAITDNYSSPVVPHADVVVTCPANSIASHNSIVSTIFLVDYMISAIPRDQSEAISKRLKNVGETLQEIDYHNGYKN